MTKEKRKKWNNADRQAFADGLRTKAQTFINKYKHNNKQACREKFKPYPKEDDMYYDREKTIWVMTEKKDTIKGETNDKNKI